MAGEKILSYKITAKPEEAIKNYQDFVSVVLAGAEKITKADGTSALNFSKSGAAIKKSAGEVQSALDSIFREAAEKSKAAADEQRETANKLADDIEKAGKRRIAVESELADLQDRIARRGDRGPTSKQLAAVESLQSQIAALKQLEARSSESAGIRAKAEADYAAAVLEIDRNLATQQQKLAQQTAQVVSNSGKLARKGLLDEVVTGALRKIGEVGVQALQQLPGLLQDVGAEFLQLSKDAAEAAREVEKIQKSTGFSPETIIALKTQVGEFGDVLEAVTGFREKLFAANANDTQLKQVFEDLNIEITDVNGNLRPTEELFLDLGKAIRGTGVDAEFVQTRLQQLLGEESYKKLSGTIDQLERLRFQVKDFGLVASGDALKGLKAFAAESQETGLRLQGLATILGGQLAGAFADANDNVNQGLEAFKAYLETNPELIQTTKEVIIEVGKLAKFFLENLGPALQTTVQVIQTFFKAEAALKDLTANLIITFQDTVSAGITPFIESIKIALDLVGSFGQAFNQVKAGDFAGAFKTASDVVFGLDDRLGKVKDTIDGKFSKAVESAKRTAVDFKNEVVDLANTALGNNLENGAENASDSFESLGESAKKSAESIKQLSAAATQAEATEKRLAESIKVNAETALFDLQKSVDTGTRSRLEAAQEALRIQEESSRQLLDLAQKTFDAQADLALKRNDTPGLEKAANEFRSKQLEEEQKQEAARLKIQQEAAAQRDELRSSEFKKIQQDGLDRLAEVDRAAKVEGANQEAAARRRLEIRQGEIARERSFIEDQLRENNVGVEERKRLSQELADLEIKNRETVRDAESEINDARLADAQRLEEQRSALTDKAKAELTEAIRQLDQSNLSEVEKLQQIGDLKIQLANLDVQRAERALEAAKARAQEQGVEVEKDTEVIRLETELIQLRGAAGEAAKAAADAVVAAKAREKGAIEGVNKGLSETPGKLRETGEAAEATASQLAGALGRIYADFQSFVEKAKTATSANIDSILKEAEQRFKGFTNAVFSPIEFAAFGGLKFLADQGLQEAFKSRDRLAEEARRKEQEAAAAAAAQRLADAQREAQSIASERERIEEASSKKIADLRKQESDLEKDTAQKRVEIITDGNQKILDAEKRAAEVRVRQAQDEAARLLRIERDLQAAREDSQAQSIQTLEDQRQSSLEKQADLEGQLSEAKAKGDKTAQAKIEKELARLKEDQRLAEEQAAAEDRARQTAKNQQELDLELQRISALYGSRRDFLRTVRTLEDQGRTDLLNDLKASQTREENAINEHFNQKLNRLKQQLADEDTERQKAYAKERSEADQAVNDAKADLQKRLTDLQTYHTNRLNEIKNAIAAEKAEYTKAMDALADKAAEFAKKFGTSIDAILDGFKKISDAANNTKLPGGGASSNTSTTSGGSGGGSSAEVGPRNQSPPGSTTGGNQTGNQSGGLGTDPGTYTGNGSGTAPKDSRKDSATVLAQFLARVLTFKSEGHQPLKSDLAQLRIMRDGWVLPNQDPILPLITSADYNKGLAAFKQFWTLKNVYEEWRRRRITVSFAIHLIEELVEVDFCTASDAAIYTAFMKQQIDDFGKEKFNKRPAFESVPSIAPASTPPPAGLKQAPGPTPIPGPQPQGSDFGTPITGNFGTGQFGNPITGNFGGTNTGQFGAPITDSFQVGLIRGLFGEVKSGKRDTTFAASALVDWFNKKLITRVFYDAAYARLLRYANGDKSALDNFSGANVFGNQVTGGQQFADLTTGGLQNLTAPSAESPLTVQPQQPFNLGGGGVGTRVKRPGALQIGPDQRNVTFINQIDYVDRAKLRADADKNLVTLLDQLGG